MGSDDDLPHASSSDVALPKATVNKFANEVATALDVRLTAETRELIVACCTEFVQLLSSEANDICERDRKKTITPEHVLRALTALGMERFSKEVEDEYERAKTDEKLKTRGGRRGGKEKPVLNTEELLKQQEALFAQARSDPMGRGQGS